MCGIAGIVGDSSVLMRGMQDMLHALRHRGPDGEGIEHDSHAILGHRRLSIIDLEGGRQPLINADKSIWLVCNGEIYNYKELRADLEARGHRFLTHSDCEVIIGLYEEYGDELVDHLRGMFAFGLWDSRKRRLLIARDHLGQKPLYYARTARGFRVRIRDQGAAGIRPEAARAEPGGAGSVSRAAPHRAAAVDVPWHPEAAARPHVGPGGRPRAGDQPLLEPQLPAEARRQRRAVAR